MYAAVYQLLAIATMSQWQVWQHQASLPSMCTALVLPQSSRLGAHPTHFRNSNAAHSSWYRLQDLTNVNFCRRLQHPSALWLQSRCFECNSRLPHPAMLGGRVLATPIAAPAWAATSSCVARWTVWRRCRAHQSVQRTLLYKLLLLVNGLLLLKNFLLQGRACA